MASELEVQPVGTLTAVMRPVGSIADIRKAFEDYQTLTKNLLTDDDYQTISGKKFPKKSAWRKLSTAFGVSFKIADRHIEFDDKGRVLRADFTVTATAPNGRSMDGWGSCDLHEKCCPKGCTRSGRHSHCPAAKGDACDGAIHFSHPNHDIPATAETRAKNRAASDLFGMGQVSAEEIMDAGSEPETSAGNQSASASKVTSGPVRAGDRASLIAALKAKLPESSSQRATLSAKSPEQLAKLAKSLGVEVTAKDESPGELGGAPTSVGSAAEISASEGGESEAKPVASTLASGAVESSDSPPEGHFAFWADIAQKCQMFPHQLLEAIQATPEGQGISDLRWLDPTSAQAQKIIAGLGEAAQVNG